MNTLPPRMKIYGAIFSFLLLSAAHLPAAFWNLTGSIGAHDPTIIKEGNLWWCFATGGGLFVKFSGDGRAWTEGRPIFSSNLPWWKTYAPLIQNLDVWAPDLHRFNNRTWCYYSGSEAGQGKNNSFIGLTSCSSIIAGDWRDDGVVISSKSGVTAYNAIDPNLSIDASGNPWLVFGSWYDGIQLVSLDRNTMKPTGSVMRIAKRSGGIEGANIVYANGFYYLFVSIDRCCQGVNSTYKIAYGRATSIKGPYLDKRGQRMLDGNCTVLDAGNTRWHGPGGQDVYQNGSAWVIARHSYDATDGGNHKLLINDLFWDPAFWPTY